MIHLIFAAITLGAVVLATFAKGIRLAILAVWIAGLGVGAIYLTLGAELLAVLQWIVSTLVVISFVFFAVMFGEYGTDGAEGIDSGRRKGLFSIASIVIGLAFPAVIWLGAQGLGGDLHQFPTEGNDLAALGTRLSRDHFVSLEVLALTLFLVLVGGGVIARPEKPETKEEQC